MYEIDLMIKKALKFRQKNNKKDKIKIICCMQDSVIVSQLCFKFKEN